MEKLPRSEKELLKAIPIGEEYPKTAKELSKELDLGDRAIRECISRLVVKWKIPIVATRRNGGGYYIPRNQEELPHGVAGLRAQHNTEAKRLNVLMNADFNNYKKFLELG